MSNNNKVYTHKKSNGKYVIVEEHCMLESNISKIYVCYKHILSGSVYLRPYDEFFDGRFIEGLHDFSSKVEIEKENI